MPFFGVRSVLITGAAAGIGLATARLLLADGVSVIGVDRDPLPDLSSGFLGIQADLADPAQITEAMEQALHAKPDLDGLVNCAGIYPVTPMMELDPSEWDAVLAINLRAPFLVTQAVARHWRTAEGGCRVVNVASTAAVLARPGVAHYAASKAGLVQLTKVMAVELAPLGIQVNAVAPGLIATAKVLAHAEGTGAKEHSAKLARIPSQREGTPEEVARAIRWLLSDDASYATGAVLTLDGGFTLGIPAYGPAIPDH
ncbi:MAG: SDR family NAD(P)-dependent oxidoreductase [Pseudomonadota bacterium]